MLTFETDDFDHKPEINHIEGESWKIVKKNSKKKGRSLISNLFIFKGWNPKKNTKTKLVKGKKIAIKRIEIKFDRKKNSWRMKL